MNIPSPETMLALFAAFGLGALHSFEPGHAKSVMAAYFIGRRRRLSDAVALGIIVAVAHTLSVFALALGARLLATQISEEKIEAPAELLGGLVMLGFGVWMLLGLRRHRELFRPNTHEHDHDCPYPHRHDETEATSLGQLFSVGLACGLVPCPQGLALLTMALGAGNLALSIWYVAAFSLGIGAAVIGLGVVVCKAQTLADRIFGGLDKHGWKIQLAGGLIIVMLGAVLAIRAAMAL